VEVGKWKCGGCGAWNEVQNDAPYIAKEMKQTLQDDQLEGRGIESKGPKEEPEQTQIKVVAELGADALEGENGMQEPAREIADSEDDVDEGENDISPEHDGDDGDDGEHDHKLAERRLTRSANKQNANKRR
jgi:hypothetical protein